MKKLKYWLSFAIACLMMISATAFTYANSEEGTTDTADTTTTETKKGTITITNPQKDAVYNLYKIFDVFQETVVEPDNDEESAGSGAEAKTKEVSYYTYTIDTDSPWLPIIKKYQTWNIDSWQQGVTEEDNGKQKTTEGNGIKLSPYSSSSANTIYLVTLDTTSNKPFDITSFSKFVKDNIPYKTGSETEKIAPDKNSEDNGEITADNTLLFSSLDMGYWLVTTDAGSLVNLTTTNPNAEIEDKNNVKFGKEVDDSTVYVNQIVHYTVTGEVPDTKDDTSYLYQIKDNLTDGLTFNITSLKVTFSTENPKDGKEASKIILEVKDDSEAEESNLNPDESKINPDDIETLADDGKIVYPKENYKLIKSSNGFILIFEMTDYKDYAGYTITVSYSAQVNEKAIEYQSIPNTAYLDFGNDPGDFKEITSSTKIYPAKITVNKTDAATSEVLEGAEFILKKVTTTTVETGSDTEPATTKEEVYFSVSSEETENGTDSGVSNSDTEESEDELASSAVLKQWVTDKDNATVLATDENGQVVFDGIAPNDTKTTTVTNQDGTTTTTTVSEVYYLIETKAPSGYNLPADPSIEVKLTLDSKEDGTKTVSGTSVDVKNSKSTLFPSTGGMGTWLLIVGGAVAAVLAILLLRNDKNKQTV